MKDPNDPSDPECPLGIDEEPENIWRPGYKNYIVYCDESGIVKQDFYSWGSLWIPNERRGDLTGLVNRLRQEHSYSYEIKWTKVKKQSEPFYRALLEEFFKTRWMMFHCLVVRGSMVDLSLHRDGITEARLKHLAMLIEKKIGFFSAGATDKAYHVRVDPLPSGYRREDEKLERITNALLNKKLGRPAIHSLITRDSKGLTGIQVADFLLGAVTSDWNGDASAEPKLRISKEIAEYVGWTQCRGRDTWPWEWKFNVWVFWDPKGGFPREADTADLVLKYPVPRHPRAPRNRRGPR